MIADEAFRQALVTLRGQRLRTVLTMFGVFWGTASVVFLLAWGRGLERMIEAGFQKIGRDLALAWAGRIGEQYTPAADRRLLWFTRDDVEAVRRRARLALLVGGESFSWSVVGHGQRAYTEDVRGVEPVQLALRGVALAAGRPISQDDLDRRSRVTVLGAKVRAKLLGSEGGVGSRIRIDGRTFLVVGILEPVGTQLWRDRSEIDDQIWIPLTTLLGAGPRRGLDEEVVDNVLFRFPGREQYEAAKQEVRNILSERLRVSPDDHEAIYVVGPTDALRQLPLQAIQVVFFILAVTTLVIGGVGIMNMMLDSVHERRAEIGVRLAVGARRRDVVLQFFLETLVATGAGGLLGIAFGVAGSLALGALQVPDLIPLPILDGRVVALAFGVLLAVGVAAGVLPAWRAARVDPAEILRAE